MQKKGIIVISDAKRGDIGDISKAYAEFKRRWLIAYIRRGCSDRKSIFEK